MNHFLFILLIYSIGFTQELTVDGNLNVTGNIQNQTIDSLQQVIAGLQSQINSMNSGNKLESRVFQTSTIGNGDIINIYEDLSEPIGPLDFYFMEIVDATGLFASQGDYTLEFRGVDQDAQMCQSTFAALDYPNGYVWLNNDSQAPKKGLFTTENLVFIQSYDLTGVLTVVITAQFPSANAPTDQAPAPPQNSRTAP